jgi:SAM-dependent methyltransferase
MINKYLQMQRNLYDTEVKNWNIYNQDVIVGSYYEHNNFPDYDLYLFPNLDFTNKIALEYGCGTGRNLIKFANKFQRIDGTDISQGCLDAAAINLASNNIPVSNLYLSNGNNIPVDNNTYDVIFAVICLQHICVHEIRYQIMQDVFRTLKLDGWFCFQMGFGGRTNSVDYFENDYNAQTTNGGRDVSIHKEQDLIDDLGKIGFKNYKSHLGPTGPNDEHQNWLWVQVQK